MASLGPLFCDITWGAGGTTADLTLEIANKMQNMASKSSVVSSVDRYKIDNSMCSAANWGTWWKHGCN